MKKVVLLHVNFINILSTPGEILLIQIFLVMRETIMKTALKML